VRLRVECLRLGRMCLRVPRANLSIPCLIRLSGARSSIPFCIMGKRSTASAVAFDSSRIVRLRHN
jgi:hypothetical protein